jgi:hypothetical protein
VVRQPPPRELSGAEQRRLYFEALERRNRGARFTDAFR